MATVGKTDARTRKRKRDHVAQSSGQTTLSTRRFPSTSFVYVLQGEEQFFLSYDIYLLLEISNVN